MNETSQPTVLRPMRLSMGSVCIAAGVAVFAVGLFVAPERIWSSWLVAVTMLIGLALTGPVFIAITRVSSGGWADPLLPLARAMGASLPRAAALAVFVVLGVSTLYEWSHLDVEHAGALVAHKLSWLDTGAFFARSAVCLMVWIFGAAWMYRREGRGRAAVFLILFAVTFSIFSFDWIMSLEAEWFSTMFGLYNFAGMLLTGIAALVLIALELERSGSIAPIADGVRHDLGKLLFALSFFWGYIWYCQYMLIWYTNMPEETGWFHTRLSGGWTTMTLLSLAANFLIPFTVLLSAPAKRNRYVLARIALLLLIGRWLDLYVMITPASFPEIPPLGLWEIAPPAAVVVAFFVWTRHRAAAIAAADRKASHLSSHLHELPSIRPRG